MRINFDDLRANPASTALRAFAGDWCFVEFTRPTLDNDVREMMPREPQGDGEWRFTDRATGMEFFLQTARVVCVATTR